MKLLKVLLPKEEGGYFTADAFQDDEARLWLVPYWRVHLSEPYRVPTRIIRLDPDEVQWTPGDPRADCVLGWPIPTLVLDGKTVAVEGIAYEVEEAPSIRIQLETRLASPVRKR